MADVKIKTVELELKTVKLTKSILKQMPILSYDIVKKLLKPDGHPEESAVIGWVHGSVLDKDREHDTWIVFKVSEGKYGLYSVMGTYRLRYEQIYVV